jgi:hypothetical protein
MRIQYDSSDLDVLPCFTFVANDVDDQEQLTDMILWLSSLNIRTSRTVIRGADGSKMVCLLVNEQPSKPVVLHQQAKPTPQQAKPTQQQSDDEESEEETDEESENEVVPKAKPQAVVQKTVIKKK